MKNYKTVRHRIKVLAVARENSGYKRPTLFVFCVVWNKAPQIQICPKIFVMIVDVYF